MRAREESRVTDAQKRLARSESEQRAPTAVLETESQVIEALSPAQSDRFQAFADYKKEAREEKSPQEELKKRAEYFREELIIDSVLEHFSSEKEAKKITELKGPDGKAVVKADGIDKVTITVGGRERHFELLHRETDEKTGFKATAWVETGSSTTRICFPGNTFSRGDVKTVSEMMEGKLGPQSEKVPGFVKQVIKLAKEKGSAESICIGSHSLGATHAVYANHILQSEGITSKAILIEPFGANLAVEKLASKLAEDKVAADKKQDISTTELRDAFQKKYAKEILEELATVRTKLEKDVFSFRSEPKSKVAAMALGTTADERKTYNKPIGELWTIDMPIPPRLELGDSNHSLAKIAARLLEKNYLKLYEEKKP